MTERRKKNVTDAEIGGIARHPLSERKRRILDHANRVATQRDHRIKQTRF